MEPIEVLQLIEEYLAYQPDTGLFMWKVAPSKSVNSGSIAGVLSKNGYIVIRFRSKYYRAHRLAWLITHRSWPSGVILHNNQCKTDNRISNLSEGTTAKKNLNKRLSKNSTSGVTGVYWVEFRRKWKSGIRVKNKYIHLGYFDTLFEAVCARRSFEINHRNNLAD